MPGGGLKDTTIDAVLETTDNRIYLFLMTERRGSVTRKRAQYDVAKGIVSRVLPAKKYKNVPGVRHITIAPGQLLNEKSCIMISQETLEYSPSEAFDGDHSEIRRRYFHRKGAYRKIFLNLDYEGPDKEKEQFMHDLKEPDYRKIQNPVLRRVMQEIKGDEEAMEIMCVRVEAFAKEIAKEYAAAEVKQANERADEYARKAAKSEKDLADTRKELDKTKSIANAFKSSVLARWFSCRKASASDEEAMIKLSEEFGVEEELISGLLKEAIA
ncbi:MAG: hypothetical protein IKD69_01795 [Solobacterium sp.]|nr:hypothetical protein [Solobacterium sp.]